jgi:tRNA (cmo5U34)-methyltransferase
MKNHSKLVKEHFENEYKQYDEIVRKLIPKYEEMHQLVVDLVNFPKESRLDILDLGSGTGQTALKILKKFPNAKIDGIDISNNMIEQSKIRLKNYLDRIKFKEEDIIDSKFIKKYDAVVSVLCIHHLNSKQKQEFFKKIFETLDKEGIFIIGDIIKFDTEKETKEKEKEWKNYLVSKLGEEKAEFWFDNYKEEDLPDSINNQLKWLRNVGFKETKCLWRHMNYAVFYGKKQTGGARKK